VPDGFLPNLSGPRSSEMDGAMNSDAARRQVEAAYAAWDEAFNRGDAVALAGLYVDHATFLPATHAIIEGPARIEQFFTPPPSGQRPVPSQMARAQPRAGSPRTCFSSSPTVA
jgi:hypothetical protein